VIVYGAPVWGPDLLFSKTLVDKLMKFQRRAALRSTCSYRTVSYAAANIISALPPIDLLVDERTYDYWLRKKAVLLPLDADKNSHTASSPTALRQKTLERWVTRLATETKGSWTRSLIKDVPSWCNRKHCHLTFHFKQSLSGHGYFGKYYLCKIRKEDSEKCHHCGEAVDDAHHTLFVCPSWSSEREDVIRILGSLDPSTMV